jgi:ion channel-forming bestrophin family protein
MLPNLPPSLLHTLVTPRGSLSRGVPLRTLAFGAIAAGVWGLHRSGFQVHLPVGLHEVAGFIIALILAFRTNTAYARFWEGRTLWGGIVNASRNLTRAVVRYGHLEAEEARAFTAWVVVFAHATRRSLRAQNEAPEIDRLLPDGDREPFASARHRPLYVAGRVSEQIAALAERGALNPMIQAHAEGQLASLVDYLGGCERIERTPTPVGYVLLLERAIAFYLATVPFAIIDPIGGFVVPVTMMVAYLVLMIEALGRELDNPFGHEPNDLPLSRICSKIEFDLLGSSPEVFLRPQGPKPAVED